MIVLKGEEKGDDIAMIPGEWSQRRDERREWPVGHKEDDDGDGQSHSTLNNGQNKTDAIILPHIPPQNIPFSAKKNSFEERFSSTLALRNQTLKPANISYIVNNYIYFRRKNVIIRHFIWLNETSIMKLDNVRFSVNI